MNGQFIIDWKFVLALGGSAAFIIAFAKLDNAATERLLTHAVDFAKEYLVVYPNAC